jgi:hypothetical protein
MARYSLGFSSTTTTSGGTASGTTLTSSGYPFFLQGGSSTQQLKINEVQAGGEATAASAVQILRLGRDSTVGVTAITGNFNAAMDATATAPGTLPTFGNAATTNPTRSTALGLLIAHSFNAYGGLVRWQARQGEEITVIGNTASLGEVSYSAFTGNVAGPVSGHCIYEIV